MIGNLSASGIARPARAAMFVTVVVAALAAPVPAAAAAAPLTLAPAVLDLSLAPGATATRSVAVGVPDGGTPVTAVSTDRTWLTVLPPAPVLPGSITVTVSAATLGPGLYAGAVTVAAPGYGPAVLPVSVTVTGPVAIDINFQAASAPVPPRYLCDFGEPYGARTGAAQGPGGLVFGWVTPGTTTPLNLVGNGRDRNRPGIDQRFDTFLHMQGNHVPDFTGVRAPGSFELAVPNGEYTVTVAVGDRPSNGVYDSVHRLTVEGTV